MSSQRSKGSVPAIIAIVVALAILGWFGYSALNKKMGDSDKTPAARTSPYKVGILSGLDFFGDSVVGLKEKMTALGYVEGTNITYQVERTNFEPEREQQILKGFIEGKVDAIFSFPTEVSIAAKQATAGMNIPVIFANAGVEGVNIIESIKEPGANITGVRLPAPDLSLKRAETLLQIIPKAKTILSVYQKGYPIVPPQLEVLRPFMTEQGITLIEIAAADTKEAEAELAKLRAAKTKIDGVLIILDPLMVTPDAFAAVAKFAKERNVPIGGAMFSVGEYNSLFGVMTNAKASGVQAAVLLDQILRGSPAGKTPVATAEAELKINKKEADRLGITLSEGLYAQAVEIIK